MKDSNNPRKYIFHSENYHVLPRWPNDGIEQFKRVSESRNTLEQVPLFFFGEADQAMAKLLGDMISRKSMQRQDEEAVFFIPYVLQRKAAREQQNVKAAKQHLVEAYRSKDEIVRDLLEQIGAKSAIHKASRDIRRFPDFEALMCKLLVKELASDANMELLFGDVAHVRGYLFELGPLLEEPPPEDLAATIAFAATKKAFGQGITAAAKKECAECGRTSGHLVRCTGCFSVHYCGKECQRAAWIVHKPDCLETQGKPVSDAVRAKADAKIKEEQEEAEFIKAKEEEEKEHNIIQYCVIPFYCEVGNQKVELYDTTGQKRIAHLPQAGLEIMEQHVREEYPDIEINKDLLLAVFPNGINPKMYSPRGWLLTDNSKNGANIIVLYQPLFVSPSNTGGAPAGFAIDLFVVKEVFDNFGMRAVWKQIDEPYKEDCIQDDIVGFRNGWMQLFFQRATKESMALESHVNPTFIDAGLPLGRYHVTLSEDVEGKLLGPLG